MNYVASGYVKTGYVRQDSDTVGNYTFDKYGKFIYVSELATTCDLADVWSRWEDWIIVGDNTKIKPAMKYSGFDPIPTGYTGATFFVYNGWRVIINPAVTAITGVLYSEDYDTGYWTYDDVPLPIYPITVSAVVNTVTIDGGSSTTAGLTPEQEDVLNNININTTDIPTAVETSREVWSTELPLINVYPSVSSYPSETSYPTEGT